MTDDQNINDSQRSQDGRSRVVRDPSFVRVFADNVTIQNLGRDVDLCLIQYGEPLTHIISTDTEMTIESADVVTESGRVRLAWPVAVNAAINLLSLGIEVGLIKGDKVVERLREEIDAKKAQEAQAVEGEANGN